MRKMVTRRDLLKKSLMITSLALIGKLALSDFTAQSREVRVFNYSYYIDPRVNEWFERETGIKVIYDEYESGEEALAKLQIGGGGYDVIIMPSEYLRDVINNGFVKEIDKSLVPNIAFIDESYFNNPHDPGLKYSVPYLGGTTGLGVNAVKVTENIDSWGKILEDTQFLGKYKKKISMLEEFPEVFGTVMIYLGLDPSRKENWNDETGKRVAEILIKQKPYIAGYYGASVYIPQLASEQLLIAHAWSGDVETARRENSSISYVIPEEGALKWNDFAVIPRDAKNIEEAYAWINFVTDPLISVINSVYTFYISPIKSSYLKTALEKAWSQGLIEVSPETYLENPAFNPPSSVANKLRYYTPLTQDILRIVEETRKKVLGEGVQTSLVIGGVAAAAIAAGIGGYYGLRKKKS